MIVYFSKTGNTRMCANAVRELTGEPVFQLAVLHRVNMFSLLFKCLLKQGIKVYELPDIEKEKSITLCSPIYAGNITPYCTYFLKKVNLKGKKVHVVLTCSMDEGTEKFVQNVKLFLNKLGIDVGAVHISVMRMHPKPPTAEVREMLQPFVEEKTRIDAQE